jgi:putative transcriptional regulator
MTTQQKRKQYYQHQSLTGQLLIANPQNPRDELDRSLILVVSHNPDLAIGLQLNLPIRDIDLCTVAFNSHVDYDRSDPLYYGGNMNANKIHVVHSTDWQGLTTVQLNDQIAITNDLSIIMAISRNDGPEQFRACAGYWIWNDGRLDKQLDPRIWEDPHTWETVSATPDLIFDESGSKQWRRALDRSIKNQIDSWF